VPADVGAEEIGARAELLAVVADPIRLRVLDALAEQQRCVCELQEKVPVAANLLSYHLKVLSQAGLIVGTRRGRWIDYRLAADALGRLRGALPVGVAAASPGGLRQATS
jgi:ArsR family transcriptional regulator